MSAVINMLSVSIFRFSETKMDESSSDQNLCVFRYETCCDPEDKYSAVPLTDTRKETAVSASVNIKDGLKQLLKDCTDDLLYHSNCYFTYISPDHINRKKRKSAETGLTAAPPKRKTRASSVGFNFKVHCFVCGDICNVIPDKKHPDRWKKNKAFQCRTADRGKDKLTHKEFILSVCAERGDEKADRCELGWREHQPTFMLQKPDITKNV